MLWFSLTLLSALSQALLQVTQKRSLESGWDALVIVWANSVFSLPWLLPLLFWMEWPVWTFQTFGIFLLAGSLNLLASFLMVYALKLSDLSLTAPMLAFSPAFLLVTSPLMLGEQPGLWGIGGVLFIVAGSYLLHLKEIQKGYWAPFQALWKESGPRWMLVVALILAILANLDKMGAQATSPVTWGIFIYLWMSLALLPYVLWKQKKQWGRFGSTWRSFSQMGFLIASGNLSGMIAITLTLAPYMIAVKRTSILMSVFFGYWYFNERHWRERALGAGLMLGGIILIAWQTL